MTPSWINTGTSDTLSSGTTNTPSYPASPVSGRIFFLQCLSRASNVTTPFGWTSLYADTQGGIRQAIFSKIATGSESGTLTVSYDASDVHSAVIHQFDGGTTPTLESAGLATGNSASLVPANIVTTDVTRVGILFGAELSGQTIVGAVSGNAGGTWVARYTESLDDTPFLATVAIATASTVSGGSQTVPNTHWIARTVALYDAGAGGGGGGGSAGRDLPILGVG